MARFGFLLLVFCFSIFNNASAQNRMTGADAYTARDYARAIPLLTQECDNNHFASCSLLGTAYYHGDGVAADILKSERLYRKACDGGYNFACARLRGERPRISIGVSVPSSAPTAPDIAALTRDCNGGNFETCESLAQIYHARNDFAQAHAIHARACENNHFKSCLYLARDYQRGRGFEKDQYIAATYFEKACNGNEKLGCSELAQLYRDGQTESFAGGYLDFVPDREKAVSYFRRACGMGDEEACMSVADTYRAKIGNQEPDFTKAKQEYEVLCGRRKLYACIYLGDMFAAGEGMPQNRNQAIFYYRLVYSVNPSMEVATQRLQSLGVRP